jgi:hypothetical protein
MALSMIAEKTHVSLLPLPRARVSEPAPLAGDSDAGREIDFQQNTNAFLRCGNQVRLQELADSLTGGDLLQSEDLVG